MIVSLKREVTALREENSQLRKFIQVGRPPTGELGSWPRNSFPNTNDSSVSIDKERLQNMEPHQLVETVLQFLSENAALRQENWELISVRDLLIRDQELVCRENERLLKKLEDVNSVCSRSPIAPARPTYSAEILNKSHSEDELSSLHKRDDNWAHTSLIDEKVGIYLPLG